MSRIVLLLGSAVLIAACAATKPDTPPAAPASQPNILLIVVDDMGFSDLSSFGGEIPTPNLDALAKDGLRLTNFHAAPMCSPSRAMLLTGVDPHKAGLGNMLEELAPNQQGQPGYEGHLNDRVVTVATLLRDAGYRTYLSGKWHLGGQPENYPTRRGFDRAFSLLTGGASHFADMKPAYAPTPEAKAKYVRDGEMLTELPDNFQYSSQFYADQMLSYLAEDSDAGQPFFAFLSFTAPHWPLQAPDHAIAKYAGRYDSGYDVLLAERLQRMKTMGLVPTDSEPVARPPKGVPWEQLNNQQRRVEARAMEIYAAMIDQMDYHTGRLINYLRETGQLDNTVVVFLSDNGAEGHDLDETWPGDLFPAIRKVIDETHDFSFEAMGKPGSYTLYGPNWARVGAPTFRLHKGFPTEGGTRVTAFVHYPKSFVRGQISDQFVSIADITPTLLELAGAPAQQGRHNGRPVEPVTGLSQMGLLTGAAESAPLRAMGQELMGKLGMRHGDWKMVHMPPPWGNGQWQLYNVALDPAESHDLADLRPDKLAELEALWESYAQENGVIIPDWVSGY